VIPVAGAVAWLASESVPSAEVEPGSLDRRPLGVAIESIPHSPEMSIAAWHGHATMRCAARAVPRCFSGLSPMLGRRRARICCPNISYTTKTFIFHKLA